MKTLLLIFLAMSFSFCLSAQYVDIGDTPLRAFLINKYPACFNASLQMDTTCSAITTETTLDMSFSSFGADMSGLHFFDNLRILNFQSSSGDLLYNLPPTVEHLDLRDAYVTLDSFPPSLKWLDCSKADDGFGPYSNGASNLARLPAGLEYFNAANRLISLGNNTTWPATLRYINLATCVIRNLPPLPVNLDTLIVNDQYRYDMSTHPPLTSLPSLPPTLKYLDCSGNGLTSLPALPDGIRYLNCSLNTMPVNSVLTYQAVPGLTSLPALPSSLEYLSCRGNAISGPIVLPSALIFADCSYNAFSVNVFDGTNTITYSSNGISNFTTLPSNLQYLNVSGNKMSLLPSLPASLIDLSVADMVTINLLPPLPLNLRFLDVHNTNIICLPFLPTSMSQQSPYRTLPVNLFASDGVDCLPNTIPGLIIHRYIASPPYYGIVSIPECNLFNNPDNCQAAPTMTGFCFYDNNGNGLQDPGDLPMEGVKVSLANGEVAFSGDDGVYAIGGQLGANVLTVTPLTYYTAVPTLLNYNFTRYDTVVNALIALRPNQSIDSLKISITPLNPARPGFSFAYNIHYENLGTTVMPNAVVSATFDGSSMSYISSTPGVVRSGNILSFNAGNLSPRQRGEFTGYFTLFPTIVLGSEITGTATITSGASTYSDLSRVIVQGSFDPNEKYATNILSRQEVTNGAYIDYVICFQNTGTDTAFNVQLRDELDSRLDASSFAPIASSHTCISRRSGNILSFDFNNILLPDENTNEPASHGYVRFRVKPIGGLPDNTTIPNAAGIYFDFNAPVITDTVTSLVNVAAVPVTLTDFTARRENKQVSLRWNTAQEINSRNFIVERAGSDRLWKSIGNIAAAGNTQLPSFYEAADHSPFPGMNYYRLRMNDINGSYVYSPIRQIIIGKNGSFVVSPNPAHSSALLTFDQSMIGGGITVFDQFGKKVYSGKIDRTDMVLDIAAWQPGIYYVNVLLKDKKLTEKLMVH